jgi:hypothetical protein
MECFPGSWPLLATAPCLRRVVSQCSRAMLAGQIDAKKLNTKSAKKTEWTEYGSSSLVIGQLQVACGSVDGYWALCAVLSQQCKACLGITAGITSWFTSHSFLPFFFIRDPTGTTRCDEFRFAQYCPVRWWVI